MADNKYLNEYYRNPYLQRRTYLNPGGSFAPSVYVPEQADLNLLARSLDKIEEREEKMATQRLALSEAFSKARQLLPDNEETNQYITDQQNRVMNTIDTMVGIGDMSNALKRSKQLASEFISSPEYNARVKEHEQRKEWLADLDKSNVDNYIKEYYKDTYQDRNNFTRNEYGDITGTAGWEAPLPEQSQSANAIIQMAVKATADERKDNASSWTEEDGTGGHNANRREWLTAKRISKTAKSIINNDPKIRQSFVDQFNAGIHQINKLTESLNNTSDAIRREEIQNQIDSYKSIFYKNGAPLSSADAYIDKLFNADNDEIKNAAYDYKHYNTGSNKHVTGGGGGINLSGGAEVMEGANVTSQAANVSFASTSGASVPTRGDRSGLR